MDAISIIDIPDDVLGEIFSFLSLPELLRASKACSTFYHISHLDRFYQNRTISLIRKMVTEYDVPIRISTTEIVHKQERISVRKQKRDKKRVYATPVIIQTKPQFWRPIFLEFLHRLKQHEQEAQYPKPPTDIANKYGSFNNEGLPAIFFTSSRTLMAAKYGRTRYSIEGTDLFTGKNILTHTHFQDEIIIFRPCFQYGVVLSVEGMAIQIMTEAKQIITLECRNDNLVEQIEDSLNEKDEVWVKILDLKNDENIYEQRYCIVEETKMPQPVEERCLAFLELLRPEVQSHARETLLALFK